MTVQARGDLLRLNEGVLSDPMHVGREGGGLARREAGVRYDLPATDKVLLGVWLRILGGSMDK